MAEGSFLAQEAEQLSSQLLACKYRERSSELHISRVPGARLADSSYPLVLNNVLGEVSVNMEGTAQRRIENISGHFDVVEHPSSVLRQLAGPTFDVLALQRILEHDNFETRQRMKELMKQDLFVP